MEEGTTAQVVAMSDEYLTQTQPQPLLSRLKRRERPSSPREPHLHSFVALSIDVLTLALAAVALELTRHASAVAFSFPWFLVFSLLVLARFAATGTYGRRVRPEMIEDARAIVIATALAAMAMLSLRVFSGDVAGSGDETARLWVFSTVYLIAGRLGLRVRAFELSSRARRFSTPTLIFGAGDVGELLARRLLDDPKSGLRPVGFLDKYPLHADGVTLPVLGGSWDLEEIVSQYDVGHIVVTFSTAPTHVVVDLIRRCASLNVVVSMVPRLFESLQGHVSLDYFGAVPLLTVRLVDANGWRFKVKYAADRFVAFLILVLLLPLLVVVIVAVYVSVGRPIFFRQTRVGKGGKEFELLKFRSMKAAPAGGEGNGVALAAGMAPGGVEGDDRRTRTGAIIRRWSIDELPQLINVLMGDMSLVGPRPERPEFVERFSQEIYRYGDRHRVKVGITGWAQIHGLRGKTSLKDRVEWDNFYIENWSPWLDVKIILLTLVALVGTAHAAE
jgi:exopolysaccharide biosynthesis polyprenyl glycosylphosphotransferase